MSKTDKRKLRLGIAGLGRAFTVMLPTFTGDPRVTLVAAADPRAEARARFAADFSAKSYANVEELSADPVVEAIYIATPHQFHAQHAALAAQHGKHLLVEKPIALSLAECSAIIEATKRAGVHLIVGHSHSFDAPVARLRALIESGEFGAVRMINAINYTDYLYRPRRPEELDTAQGGGAVFNQAAHHVDIVRLIGGGHVTSVRAATGAWDAARPTEGAYAALLTFANGAFASLTYSGYGQFDSDEWQGWVSEMGQTKSPYAGRGAPALLRCATGSRLQERPQLWRPGLSSPRRFKSGASEFRHASGKLRTRRPARSPGWRHDLPERHIATRRRTSAFGAACRGDRRTVSRGRARQGATA